MRKAAAAAFVVSVLSVGPASAGAPEAVGGRVFADANRNGKLDTGEKGIEGVRVTDGVEFALTGPDGSYRIRIGDDPVIPYRPARVVSVSWPSGSWPTGKWWARLDQIEDAAAVNFGLRQDKQSLPFAFVHVTDGHSSGGMYEVLAANVRQLGGMVRFCVNTGDLGYASMQSAEGMFTSLAARSKRFPVGMMFVPGNHDVVGIHSGEGLKQHPLAGNGAYTKYLGPVRWSFDYAGVHFVGVDWTTIKHGKLESDVPEVAAKWLEKDLKHASLKPGTRKFLFVHFPTGCPLYYKVIARYKVSYIFGGHNHTYRHYRFAGIPAVTALNLRGQGGGNLGIVQKDRFDVVAYCEGCKGPLYHSKRCALGQLERNLLPALRARRGRTSSVVDRKLSDATWTMDVAGAGAAIAAVIEPGKARRVGLKIGHPRPVEIAFTGEGINAAGVPIPFKLKGHDKGSLNWYVVADGGKLTLYANGRNRLIRALKIDRPGKVSLFAEGGPAVFKKVDIWELKPKADPNSKAGKDGIVL